MRQRMKTRRGYLQNKCRNHVGYDVENVFLSRFKCKSKKKNERVY